MSGRGRHAEVPLCGFEEPFSCQTADHGETHFQPGLTGIDLGHPLADKSSKIFQKVRTGLVHARIPLCESQAMPRSLDGYYKKERGHGGPS
ncbi:hypothetical protein, partial [Verrucomicrobium spinosum]|uniref:hypothetical protein n=1 Tax=Verrucomicrobium spinosum TaxID=2736 RepID=UPI001C487717